MAYCDDHVKNCFKSADHVGSEDRLLPWHLYNPWHRLPGDYSHLRHSFMGSWRTWHRPSKLDMIRSRPWNMFSIDDKMQRWPSWASLAAAELGKSPHGCLARSVGRASFLFRFSPFPFSSSTFYRTRVRSLFTLVTNSLTDSLTDSLTHWLTHTLDLSKSSQV